jgi:transposase-like protein
MPGQPTFEELRAMVDAAKSPPESTPARPVPRLLTLVAVATSLSVSPHTVRSWVRKGRLKPTRICRRLLFDPAEVARFVSEAK